MAEVLIVEDNPVNRRLVQSLLLQAGYEVDMAEHGAQALSMIERQEYALVLMDLNMPVMDGFETIRVLRRSKEYQVLPVIAVTVDTSEGIKERVRDAGFTDYLAKPYTRADLLESVRFHLSESMDA